MLGLHRKTRISTNIHVVIPVLCLRKRTRIINILHVVIPVLHLQLVQEVLIFARQSESYLTPATKTHAIYFNLAALREINLAHAPPFCNFGIQSPCQGTSRCAEHGALICLLDLVDLIHAGKWSSPQDGQCQARQATVTMNVYARFLEQLQFGR